LKEAYSLPWKRLLNAGISTKAYLTKAKSVGAKTFRFLNDPADKRKVLIEFEPLLQITKTSLKRVWQSL
jgi:hypothetical protein